MMNLFTQSAAFDLKRQLRGSALLFVALAAPIAAHYMVPDKDASYAVLTINGKAPVLTAPVLGLELGVLAATLLTPLAYIFLKAGPTRNRPWQITDVAPYSRVISTLGRWIADTFVLWILLASLTVAGLILGFFRLEDQVNFLQTIIALWLPAAPALALIAAIRIFLDARNLTRSWFGDVIFFFAWIGLLTTSVIGTIDPETGAMVNNPTVDAFGFTAPIIGSVDYPVTEVTIGGASNTGETAPINAWSGVTNPNYMMARVYWIVISAVLAIIAGLIWAPKKTRQPKLQNNKINAAAVQEASISNVPFKAPMALPTTRSNEVSVALKEIGLMFKNKAWLLILAATAISGAVLPFRTMAGPAIMLALIFPLTEASARWQSSTLEKLLNTTGPGPIQRASTLFSASVLVAMIAIAPALVRMLIEGDFVWLSHAMIIAFAVPAVIVMAGMITRSTVTGRMFMLIAWYVYLSSA